jgi:CheY-like chemotaxis protein
LAAKLLAITLANPLKKHGMRNFEVVMVDDDHDDVDIMKDAFREIGKESIFKTFESGKDLLNYLDSLETPAEYPTVVLLDHNIPGENGQEILSRFKKHPLQRAITFVVFSSSLSQKQEENLKDVGAINCLTKPDSFSKYVEVATYLCNMANKKADQ